MESNWKNGLAGRPLAIFAAWAALLFALSAAFAAGSAAAGPEMVAPETEFVFESVVEGDRVLHEFAIENRGDRTLTIERVETGCGCATVEFSREIGPASSGRVAVEADTEGYGGKTFRQTVSVYSNDPRNARLDLTVAGEVEKFADVSPARLMLKGSAKDDLGAKVRIVPSAKFDFRIVGVETEDLENTVAVEVERVGDGYSLDVSVRNAPPGVYAGKLIVRTDSETKPAIEIPVLLGLRP